MPRALDHPIATENHLIIFFKPHWTALASVQNRFKSGVKWDTLQIGQAGGIIIAMTNITIVVTKLTFAMTEIIRAVTELTFPRASLTFRMTELINPMTDPG